MRLPVTPPPPCTSTGIWPNRGPDAFLPDLALSLINFSNRLSALGRQEEAAEQLDQQSDGYKAGCGCLPPHR